MTWISILRRHWCKADIKHLRSIWIWRGILGWCFWGLLRNLTMFGRFCQIRRFWTFRYAKFEFSNEKFPSNPNGFPYFINPLYCYISPFFSITEPQKACEMINIFLDSNKIIEFMLFRCKQGIMKWYTIHNIFRCKYFPGVNFLILFQFQ